MSAVLIHGYNSGPEVWEPLETLASSDPGFQQFEFMRFGYPTRLFRWTPRAVIPDLEALSESLETEVRLRIPVPQSFVLVGHSQGGLVALRYIANLLEAGRGFELRRLAAVILFACPVNGSAFMLPLRRLLLRGNSQARRLEPLNQFIARTQRVVATRALFADQVTQSTCPITIKAYAGIEDPIVTSGSAHWIVPETGRLPGDHSGIIAATSPFDSRYLALKTGLSEALERKRVLLDPDPSRLGGQKPGTIRVRPGISPPSPDPQALETFLGREQEVGDVVEALLQSPNAQRAVLVTGPAGIGKSSLVSHVARVQQDRFRDGIVRVGLNFTPEEAGASDVALEMILGSLAVPLDHMPPTSESKRQLYQWLIAKRTVLIVIEDVADPSTLDGLVPTVGQSALIATSRGDLDVGQVRPMTVVPLSGLSESASVDFLRAKIRSDVADTLGSLELRDIAKASGGAPAALDIIGHLLSQAGQAQLDDLLASLRAARDSVMSPGRFHPGEEGQDAAIVAVAYSRLADDARSTLDALALLPRTSYPRWLFELLPHGRPGGPENLLRSLASSGLLTQLDNERYLIPEAVHRFARDQLGQTYGAQEEAIVLGRLYSAYSARALYCRAVLEPERPPFGGAALPQSLARADEFGIGDAEAWMAAEHRALILLMSAAAERGLFGNLKLIANSVPTYHIIDGRWVDWVDGAETAVRAAESDGDLRLLAYSLQTLANLQRTLGFGTGRPLIQRSFDTFVEVGDVEGQAYTLNDLGLVKMYDGEWRSALGDLALSETMLLELGNVHLAAHPLRNRGITHLEMGEPKQAIEVLSAASEVFNAHKDVRWAAYTLGDLAKAYRLDDQPEPSRETFTKSIAMLEKIRDERWAAVTRLRLADLLRKTGSAGDAAELYSQAARTFSELDDSLWHARALVGRGLAEEDASPINRGLETFRLLDSKIDVCWALVAKYRVLRDHAPVDARSAWDDATRTAILLGRYSSLVERFLNDEGPDVR